ncbi:drug/metabolite transporter (DMT)-like permease [Stella humosa]|uniref:Drug/metabolite transporter (DMT)-like permease n=1 Tax=Stella humosa TaxID=94 RepID=A0A3N1MGS7_9PROT|nr:DMT family transporter [Stella humosa]ROQ01967.1 drug/metabolite transporter (DMT)-like permease [Stella humosa]BBK32356.1 transporter [Stella humosa]
MGRSGSADGQVTLFGYALLAVVWMSWGLSYPVMRIALDYIDPWASRCLVMLLAGTFLLAVARATGHSLRVPRDHWRDLVVVAIINMSIFQIGMTYGVLLLSPGRTALLIYTMPIWTAILATLFLKERPTPRHLAALCLGIAGIAVLMSQDLSKLANAPAGAALTLMAAFAFAAGTILLKRRIWRVDVGVLAGWQLLVGVLPLLAIWSVADVHTDWAAIPLDGWLAVAFLAYISNAAAYLAWFRVVASLPATVSGIGILAVPVVGLGSSAIVVGEAVGPHEIAALLCIGSALGITLLPKRRLRRN